MTLFEVIYSLQTSALVVLAFLTWLLLYKRNRK